MNGARADVDAAEPQAPKVPLDEATVWAIKYLSVIWGLDNAAIGRRFNLPRTTVRDVILGKTWSHVQPWLLGGTLNEIIVRNLVPERMAARGRPGIFRPASGPELARHLEIYLVEKLNTFLIAESEQERLELLVDLIEGIYALAKNLGKTPLDLEKRRSDKARRVGDLSAGLLCRIKGLEPEIAPEAMPADAADVKVTAGSS